METEFDRRRVARVTLGLAAGVGGLFVPKSIPMAIAQTDKHQAQMEDVSPLRTSCASMVSLTTFC